MVSFGGKGYRRHGQSVDEVERERLQARGGMAEDVLWFWGDRGQQRGAYYKGS